MKLDKLVTFKVDEELKKKMERFNVRINWSAWLRKQIDEKIKQLKIGFDNAKLNHCPQCGVMISLDPGVKFCDKCGTQLPGRSK